MPRAWQFLAIAIVSEIVATSALKECDGLRRVLPVGIAVIGYVIAFYFLAKTLQSMPLGIAYAVWSGVGIVALTAIGVLVYRQPISLQQYAGIAAILGGVVLVYAAD
ncbi:MAG: DMT family transporter [Novosphingobium sp.]